MQPGQIRVFDGLRVTTEHVTHLQGALHSALRDLRSIMGPGVYRGLQVGVVNGSAVIQPGLGIDFDGNRVVRDDPATLPVGQLSAGEVRFVCLKYEQVETGEVEGKSTLIWDSSTPVLTPVLPAPKDNLVVLARVVATANGTLAVEHPMPMPEAPPPADAAAATPSVEQGVVRIAEDPSAPDPLRALLTAALRRTPVIPKDFAVHLVAREVELAFAPSSVSCDVIITAMFVPAAVEGHSASPLQVQARCSGEAIFEEHAVAQFGVCSAYGPSVPGYGQSCWSDVTEQGVGRLAIDPENAQHANASLAEILRNVQLQVLIEPGKAGKAFGIVCQLLWSGDGGETVASAIETQLATTHMEIVIAWKAQGVAPARTPVSTPQ